MTNATSSQLEAFCWQFLNALNNRDYQVTSLRGGFASNFTSTQAGYTASSIEDFLRSKYALAQRYPDLKYHFVSATTNVREEEQYAEVHIFTEITGLPNGVRRSGLNVFKWKKYKSQGNRWLCWDYSFYERGTAN